MREILFRGKRLDNGEWVYGSFCPYTDFQGNKHARIMLDDDLLFEVDPATVGQYTGLKDKNGNKIFEGDIIRSYSILGDCIFHSIQWDDKKASFKMINKYGSPSRAQDWIDEHGKEVIGNIYDNPFLMKGGAE